MCLRNCVGESTLPGRTENHPSPKLVSAERDGGVLSIPASVPNSDRNHRHDGGFMEKRVLIARRALAATSALAISIIGITAASSAANASSTQDQSAFERVLAAKPFEDAPKFIVPTSSA